MQVEHGGGQYQAAAADDAVDQAGGEAGEGGQQQDASGNEGGTGEPCVATGGVATGGARVVAGWPELPQAYNGKLSLDAEGIVILPGIIAFKLYGDIDDNAYGRLVGDVLPPWLSGAFAAAITGAVLSSYNAGLNSAFTVRKISHGFGVERVFQTHSAAIDSVTVKRRGDVRASKLYYLRGLEGKKARIREDLAGNAKAKAAAAADNA